MLTIGAQLLSEMENFIKEIVRAKSFVIFTWLTMIFLALEKINNFCNVVNSIDI